MVAALHHLHERLAELVDEHWNRGSRWRWPTGHGAWCAICRLCLKVASLAQMRSWRRQGVTFGTGPGIPVVVACPDPQVRLALAAHPLDRHLIVTPSLPALSAALSTPTPACATRTRAGPDGASRFAALRHSHPAGLEVGPGHSLREFGARLAPPTP